MRRRVVLARRGSLLLLLAWIGILLFLLADRQVRRQPVSEVPDLESQLFDATERPVSVRRGFVYSDTIGVEPNFRIAARETVEFASGWYELRDVEVWLYHQGRVAYGLVAERARYDPKKHEALARGQAHVSLRGGGVVRAEGFSFSGPEQFLQSEGAVTVAGPGWSALAEKASLFAAEDRMVLEDNVSVTWRRGVSDEPPLVLLAPSVEYFQKHSLVRSSQGLTLLHERLTLQAKAGEIQLGGRQGPGVQRAHFSGPVTLEGYFAEGTLVDLRTGDIEVTALDADRIRFTAWAQTIPGWVRLSLGQVDGSWQELRTWRLAGEGSPDKWEWVEAQEHGCLFDYPDSGEPRTLEATTMRLDFRAGKPVSAMGSGGVQLRSADQWARGDKLSYSLATARFLLTPERGGRVRFGTAELDSSADLVEGRAGGEILAKGKVSGVGSRELEGREPDELFHFAADSVSSTGENASEVVLSGDARVWQGNRLLRAERLTLDREREVVVGQGKVLTSSLGETAEGDEQGIRIRSRALEYDHRGGRAVYEGDVVMEDARGTARAQRVIAILDADGKLRSAQLEGGVSFVETGTNRTVTGQRATLDAAAEVLDVWGEPVLVQEPTGNQVRASHLRWRRDTATLLVLGADGEPTETLYRPERSPGQGTPEPGRDRP